MNILDKIVESRKKRIAEEKAACSLDSIKNQLSCSSHLPPKGCDSESGFRFILPPCGEGGNEVAERGSGLSGLKNRGLGGAFEQSLNQKEISFICEVKKASPSKGLIASNFDYKQIAIDYEKAGASAISVLTEPDFFLGKNEYLQEIKEVVSIPVLRKDFIVDEYQIYQSKLINADAILLIVSILGFEQLKKFIDLATSLGLSALVEAHDKQEIDIALKAGAKIIGVNNRDLKTFTVDLNNSIALRKFVPKEILFVSESGIKTSEDIKLLKENNVNAVLIGETLMRSENKKEILDNLRS